MRWLWPMASLSLLIACGQDHEPARPAADPPAETRRDPPAPESSEITQRPDRPEAPAVAVTDDGTPLAGGVPDFDDALCDRWAALACECSAASCRGVRAHHAAVRIATEAGDAAQHAELRRVCEQMVEHFRCEPAR